MYKNGLCWVWASGSTLNGSTFGEWRSPTENEWAERPSWIELVDHCHAKTFDGAECDIKYAKQHEKVCFCRAKGSQPCGSQHCDIMYVKRAGIRESIDIWSLFLKIEFLLILQPILFIVLSFSLGLPFHDPEIAQSPWLKFGSEKVWEKLLEHIPLYNNNTSGSETHPATQDNIIINGKSFEFGIVDFAPSSMKFSLEKKYNMFKACFGVTKSAEYDDANCGKQKEGTKFQVLVDGIPFKMNGKNWLTKTFDADPSCVYVRVGNASMLELRSQYQAHRHICGASIWADAAVFSKGIFLLMWHGISKVL